MQFSSPRKARSNNNGKKAAIVFVLIIAAIGGLYFTNSFDLQNKVSFPFGGSSNDSNVQEITPAETTVIQQTSVDEKNDGSGTEDAAIVEQPSSAPVVEERQILETETLLDTKVLLVGRDARLFTLKIPDKDIGYLQGSIIPEKNAVADIIISVNGQEASRYTAFGDNLAQSGSNDNREVLVRARGGDKVELVIKTSDANPGKSLSQVVKVNLFVTYREQIKTVSPVAIVDQQPAGTEPIKTPSGSGRDINPEQLALAIHELVNVRRTENGLASLSWDTRLQQVAQGHSDDMAARDYFDHITPEGKSPSDRAADAGYSCYKDYGSYYTVGIAENLAQHWTYSSITYISGVPFYNWNTLDQLAKEVVDGWMNSPGHRENILTASYDREAVAVTIASNDKVYVTQNFC